ncbi:MAG: hypothetical protein ACO1ON_12910 [Nocardioides sp.]
MTTDPEALYAAARELTTDLLPRLQDLIPATDTILESQIGSRRKAPAAPLPWNDAAAMLYFEIHGDARRFESLLTLRLFGTAKYRPGTDTHTHECINRLPVLIDHGHANALDPHLDLADPTNALLTWPKQIRLMLDEARPGEEPITRVPGDTRCPYCAAPLYLGAGWKALEENALAICRRCRDTDGRPLTWPVTERLGNLQHDELITEQTARHRYGLSTSTVRVWKHRGKIHPYGEDDHGRHLYRVSDIIATMKGDEEKAGAG